MHRNPRLGPLQPTEVPVLTLVYACFAYIAAAVLSIPAFLAVQRSARKPPILYGIAGALVGVAFDVATFVTTYGFVALASQGSEIAASALAGFCTGLCLRFLSSTRSGEAGEPR
jgi:hypothetical protein